MRQVRPQKRKKKKKKSPQITNAGGGVEQREPSCTAGGNVSRYNHHGDQSAGTLEIYTQNYHMTQQAHSGIYPDKTFFKKDTCTCMFIAALFTIAKTWKQHKCPLTDDWTRKMYLHTMENYSVIKKNNIMPFAAMWIELETLILSEVSQKEKDKYRVISLISGI
uniref:DUF1725 domain-containing protein n=2 Tax=Sus scrofa TaxID=9823 RepID=A0A8D1AFW4_PIG